MLHVHEYGWVPDKTCSFLLKTSEMILFSKKMGEIFLDKRIHFHEMKGYL